MSRSYLSSFNKLHFVFVCNSTAEVRICGLELRSLPDDLAHSNILNYQLVASGSWRIPVNTHVEWVCELPLAKCFCTWRGHVPEYIMKQVSHLDSLHETCNLYVFGSASFVYIMKAWVVSQPNVEFSYSVYEKSVFRQHKVEWFGLDDFVRTGKNCSR